MCEPRNYLILLPELISRLLLCPSMYMSKKYLGLDQNVLFPKYQNDNLNMKWWYNRMMLQSYDLTILRSYNPNSFESDQK